MVCSRHDCCAIIASRRCELQSQKAECWALCLVLLGLWGASEVVLRCDLWMRDDWGGRSEVFAANWPHISSRCWTLLRGDAKEQEAKINSCLGFRPESALPKTSGGSSEVLAHSRSIDWSCTNRFWGQIFLRGRSDFARYGKPQQITTASKEEILAENSPSSQTLVGEKCQPSRYFF